jgi:hypothetical protein
MKELSMKQPSTTWQFILTVTLMLCLLIGGCSMLSDSKTANQNKVDAKIGEVQAIKNKQAANSGELIAAASMMATGTDVALQKVTNPPVEVQVAMELNDRVINIIGNPTLDDANKIKKIVEELTSQIADERVKGRKALAEKDSEIIQLQSTQANLEIVVNAKTEEMNKLAASIALKADEYKGTVDKYNSWFGLGAVFYGLKRFFTTCLLALLIGGIIFLILRIFAASNPIIGAIFGIFNMIGAFLLRFIKGIVPGAVKVAGMTPSDEHQKYENVLLKLVDVIEEMKSHTDVMNVNKEYTFAEFLDKVEKDLGDTDKTLFAKLKTQLRWKV